MMSRAVSIALVLGLLALAGCGMHPLYGNSDGNGGVAQSLAGVDIPAPTDRLSQLVRNDLLSVIRPAGQGSGGRYILILKTAQANNDIIDEPQPRATRQQVVVTIDYQLLQGGRVMTSGKTFSQVSYDTVRQPLSDRQAEVDAERRAALELSADIRTRLASYFASH